jgi:hypothetical protein
MIVPTIISEVGAPLCCHRGDVRGRRNTTGAGLDANATVGPGRAAAVREMRSRRRSQGGDCWRCSCRSSACHVSQHQARLGVLDWVLERTERMRRRSTQPVIQDIRSSERVSGAVEIGHLPRATSRLILNAIASEDFPGRNAPSRPDQLGSKDCGAMAIIYRSAGRQQPPKRRPASAAHHGCGPDARNSSVVEERGLAAVARTIALPWRLEASARDGRQAGLGGIRSCCGIDAHRRGRPTPRLAAAAGRSSASLTRGPMFGREAAASRRGQRQRPRRRHRATRWRRASRSRRGPQRPSATGAASPGGKHCNAGGGTGQQAARHLLGTQSSCWLARAACAQSPGVSDKTRVRALRKAQQNVRAIEDTRATGKRKPRG